MMVLGTKVEHVLSKDWLIIVDISDIDGLVMYGCRKKDLSIVYLYPWEVVAV